MLGVVNGLPQVSCPYQAPDQCNGFEPQSCCERLAAGTSGGVAVVPRGVSVIIASLAMLWSTVLDSARL